VRVLGALEARNGDVVLRHFVSHAIGALLARLALLPQRTHPREELIELLWPGVELDVGRNRLRHALSSLKRLLEPPGVASGSVLVADRQGVQFAPAATRCDALEFERCVRDGRFDEAQSLYRGELLPGFYDEWVQDERARLIALHDRLAGHEVVPERVDGAAMPMAAKPQPELSLPGYLTGYFGREAERARLGSLVAAHRLVTLTGAGGCGKTRLAVEVAREVAGFDRVGFVALSDCIHPAQCTAQLRAALHLPQGSNEPFEQAVAQLEAEQRSLLLLDNFEQLVSTAGNAWVESLLARAPGLHLLVTSRRALGLAGEHELALAPLPAPASTPDVPTDPEQLARNPSVALFVDRSRSVRPDFGVTQHNADAVAALCRALEGLPLAIELAASRSRAFSPRDMLEALAERSSWLARPGARAGRELQRHDSLHAAIEWSLELLAPRRQHFLLALSVFRGGWSVASAQAVCDEPEARTLLDALTAHSLLRSEVDASGTVRFFMLDMIRSFLRDRLAPGQARQWRRQHRAHCLTTALGLRARGVLVIAEAELPNFLEALRSAVEDGESELGLNLALALRAQWEGRGITPEGLALLQRALDASDPQSSHWIDACLLVALLWLAAGDGTAAQAQVERALAQAGARPAPLAAALCVSARIAIERHLPADGLTDRLAEAQALAEAAGAGESVAQAIALQGVLALHERKDAAGADRLFVMARERYLALGQPREAGLLLYERTICLMELGRWADGLAQARLFERECVAVGDRQRQLKVINLQGVLQAHLRRWRDAVATYRRCVLLASQSHNHYWLGYALWNHGRNLARLREPERAALLMAFSAHFWRSRFGPLDQRDQRYLRQVRALVRHQLGASATDTLWARGAALTLAEAVQLALRAPLVAPPQAG
jgi:predicted ATPase